MAPDRGDRPVASAAVAGTRSIHRRVWGLALPTVLANLTVPLLGMVDTAVVGGLGAAEIGGVAIGATVFSFLYWGFAFLRMSTTGLAAQAHGARDHDGVRAACARSALLAVGFGVFVVIFQGPLIAAAMALLGPSGGVEALARSYTSIRIWAAPAVLANMVVLGWLLGLQRAGTALLVQAVINGANVALDFWLAWGLGLGVTGVAYASLIAQVVGLAVGVAVVIHLARVLGGRWHWARATDLAPIRALLRVNGDIFVRTLCVIIAVSMFTAQGARMGDLVLAANAILVLFQTLLSHGLDGFAHAAEALVGEALGARDRHGLRQAVKASTWAALAVAAGFSLVYAMLGVGVVALITDLPAVQAATHPYLPWLVLSPWLSVWSFQLDGVFIGATRSRDMRNAMLWSFAVYVVTLWPLVAAWGNHGLWLAFMLFMIARAVTLAIYYPALERAAAAR